MNRFVGSAIVVSAVLAAPVLAAVETRSGKASANSEDYAALERLPDWSGTWTPDISDQVAQETTNPPPWKPAVAKQIAKMYADESAGHPFEIIDHCFPTGMPSWMLITHNAFEILFTPGRVTFLGEGDGNRMRRIYTDGRAHPADPDPSFHGHSIGHWNGDTLVVDTVGLLPQAYLAVNEAVGIPNDGDMHIVERLHIGAADTLDDDLDITASKLLSRSWHTTRKYYRQRGQKYDIAEGECEQGSYTDAKDANGNDVFAPVLFHNYVPVGSPGTAPAGPQHP